MWHKLKNLPQDFKKNFFDQRVTVATKSKTAKKATKKVLKYTDAHNTGMTPEKVKNHLYHSVKLWKGNAQKIAEEFKQLSEHYAEYGLSEETKKDLDEWLDSQNDVIETIKDGLLTDLEESFHRKVLKYWQKGSRCELMEYVCRRALAALDWTENFGKKKGVRTIIFKKGIMNVSYKFYQHRSTSKMHKVMYMYQKSMM